MSIIVAGSLIMDMSVKVSNHPKIGETVIGNNLITSPGGKGLNQAVSAKRLGAEVYLIGKKGNDANGDIIRDFIEKEEIYDLLTTSYETSTGIAMIIVSNEGENNIVVVPGANMELSINFGFLTDFDENDILISQFEIPMDTVETFFKKGKENRTLNILNAAPAQKVKKELLDLVDILIVNETELETISGYKITGNYICNNDIDIAAQSIVNENQIVIVTLGENGAFGYINNSVVRVKGIKVETIDTAGAGDCFVGAIGYYSSIDKIDKNNLKEAIIFANKAASLSVQKQGTAPSMPYYNQIN